MSSSTTRTFWNITKIILALLLIWLVLAQTDLHQLGVMLKNISVFWGVGAALLYIGLTALKAFQYYLLLQGKITYGKMVHVIIVQNAVANFLATGAGIASYMTLLKIDHDIKLSRSMIVFIMTKIGDLIAIWLLFFLSAWMIWDHMAALQNLILALLLSIGLLITVFFLTAISRRQFVAFLKRTLTTARLFTLKPIQRGLNLLDTIAEVEQGWLFQRLGIMVILSTLYFSLSIAWNYAIFLAFGFRADIPTLVFINVLLQLISYFPIQVFGGLGVTESSSVYFWGLFGVSHFVMSPLMIGSRILYYLLNLLSLIYLPIYAIYLEKKQ
jgi:uncharacterized membrane protein YbhN (UPF0104 family)